MKQAKKYFSFISRSLMWSLLLFGAIMLVTNWEEVTNTMSGRNAVTIVTSSLPIPAYPLPQGGLPANISEVHRATGTLMTVLHEISELLPH